MEFSKELEQILNRIEQGQQTDEDISMLRQWLRDGPSQVIEQLGKYNINIGEGQYIYIGDRQVVEWNDEAIQKLVELIQEEAKKVSFDVLPTLPPIEEGYRFIHYILTLISLLGNLIAWTLLGFLAKSEFPIDYVWKLILACLKGPKYFSKVLNKEQRKLYEIQKEYFRLTGNLKQEKTALNKLNKSEYSIKILESTIKQLYNKIEIKNESISRILRTLESKKRLIQIDSEPLKQQYDPKLYKLERILQIITEGATSLENDFQRIEVILRTLSRKYSEMSQAPSSDSALNLLEELAQIIEKDSDTIKPARLLTLKRVLYLLQWIFASQNNSDYPNINLINSNNFDENNISPSTTINQSQSLDSAPTSEDSKNQNQNLDVTPASEDSINPSLDIEPANNSEESNQKRLDRISWISLVNTQIGIALAETDAADPDMVESIQRGIRSEWIRRVSIYGFDARNLAKIELAFDIDWNNQEKNFCNSNISGKEISLSYTIKRFKTFSLENALVVEFRVSYLHPENSDYYNKELGFYPAKPVQWATKGKIFRGLLQELQKLIDIEQFPQLSIELNFGSNTYSKITRSNYAEINLFTGCMVGLGIALILILLFGI